MESVPSDDRGSFRSRSWLNVETTTIHIGGVDVSELARVGLLEMLRQSVDEQDEIAVYERYSPDGIGEDVARVRPGEKLDRTEVEKEPFEAALRRDTSELPTDRDGE